MENEQNVSIVRRLCNDWPTLTLEGFTELLAPDCVYDDVPVPHMRSIGPEGAYYKLRQHQADWNISFDIVNIVGNGNVVMVERIEHFNHPEGLIEDWSLRCCGVFTLRNRKVTSWIDYWNLNDAEPLMRLTALKQQQADT